MIVRILLFWFLKEGNDFPKETVIDGMRYDEFESRTINHIGNIQLLNPQKTKRKGMEFINSLTMKNLQPISRCLIVVKKWLTCYSIRRI